MPACATANSVMASENRLMEVRQSCFSSSRMAEISVPAWPIPIHQTKLTMAKPQATGMTMPQTPTPLYNSQKRAGQQALHQDECDKEADPPLRRSGLNRLQYDARDLISDGGVVEPRRDDLIRAWVDRLFV